MRNLCDSEKAERLRKEQDMFNKIVGVEPILMTAEGKEELRKFCKELALYDTKASSEEELIERMKDADCVLVPYITTISANVIRNLPKLKHVALCCSYYGKQFAKVDIDALSKQNISFSYLAEHGDDGVVEYTVAQAVMLIHGIYGHNVKSEPYDLTGVKIGILGLGNLGGKIARAFRLFGSQVYYYSRTRKPDKEAELGVTYLELEDLFKTVDIISINLNRDVCLIGGDNLEIFGNDKVLINTSIGKCYEIESLKKWLQYKNNYYVCDASTANFDDVKEILDYENVIYTRDHVGETKQCFLRATRQILNNVRNAMESIEASTC